MLCLRSHPSVSQVTRNTAPFLFGLTFLQALQAYTHSQVAVSMSTSMSMSVNMSTNVSANTSKILNSYNAYTHLHVWERGKCKHKCRCKHRCVCERQQNFKYVRTLQMRKCVEAFNILLAFISRHSQLDATAEHGVHCTQRDFQAGIRRAQCL